MCQYGRNFVRTHSMCLYKFYYNSRQCVRDWSGILCERGTGAGAGTGKWERDLGMGNGNRGREREMGAGRVSEQRYSGKPDGLPERPH